jgi:tetrahydromethanopterin S-methyltransferase subunit F
MAVAVTGTVVTGTVGVVAGIMVATVVVGELAPQ